MVITNPTGNILSAVMTPVRLAVWLVVGFVLLFLWVVALVGGIALVPLYIASVVLLGSLVLLIWSFAVLYITLHGLVFLVGGVASILYLSNPIVGIALIVLGVGLEYESKRRRERSHREEVGQLLRIIEGAPTPVNAQGSQTS